MNPYETNQNAGMNAGPNSTAKPIQKSKPASNSSATLDGQGFISPSEGTASRSQTSATENAGFGDLGDVMGTLKGYSEMATSFVKKRPIAVLSAAVTLGAIAAFVGTKMSKKSAKPKVGV